MQILETALKNVENIISQPPQQGLTISQSFALKWWSPGCYKLIQIDHYKSIPIIQGTASWNPRVMWKSLGGSSNRSRHAAAAGHSTTRKEASPVASLQLPVPTSTQSSLWELKDLRAESQAKYKQLNPKSNKNNMAWVFVVFMGVVLFESWMLNFRVRSVHFVQALKAAEIWNIEGHPQKLWASWNMTLPVRLGRWPLRLRWKTHQPLIYSSISLCSKQRYRYQQESWINQQDWGNHELLCILTLGSKKHNSNEISTIQGSCLTNCHKILKLVYVSHYRSPLTRLSLSGKKWKKNKWTRRRLARERKRCFSSSSEDGSRKR